MVRCEYWKLCQEWNNKVKAKIQFYKDFPAPMDFCNHMNPHKKNKRCGHECVYPLLLGGFGKVLKLRPRCKRYTKLMGILEAL
jgi:hypothetical protein